METEAGCVGALEPLRLAKASMSAIYPTLWPRRCIATGFANRERWKWRALGDQHLQNQQKFRIFKVWGGRTWWKPLRRHPQGALWGGRNHPYYGVNDTK